MAHEDKRFHVAAWNGPKWIVRINGLMTFTVTVISYTFSALRGWFVFVLLFNILVIYDTINTQLRPVSKVVPNTELSHVIALISWSHSFSLGVTVQSDVITSGITSHQSLCIYERDGAILQWQPAIKIPVGNMKPFISPWHHKSFVMIPSWENCKPS